MGVFLETATEVVGIPVISSRSRNFPQFLHSSPIGIQVPLHLTVRLLDNVIMYAYNSVRYGDLSAHV